MPEQKPPAVEPLATCTEQGLLLALAVDARAGVAYIGGSEGAVRAWQLNGSAQQSEPAYSGRGSWLAAIVLAGHEPLDPLAITGHYDGSLTWNRLRDGNLLRVVEQAHHGWVRDLALTADGERLVSVGNDMLVKVCDARDGKVIHTLAGHAPLTPQGYVSALYTVAVSPDGRMAASGDRAGEVRIWDIEQGKLIHQWRSAEFYTFDPEKRDRSIGGIRRLRFSPDGATLAIAGIGPVSNVDGFVGPARVELWDWQAVRRRIVLADSHQAVLNDVLFSSDSRQVIAAGGGDAGGVMLAWQADQEKAIAKLKPKGHAQRLAWAGEERIVAAGHEGVQLWDRAALLPKGAGVM